MTTQAPPKLFISSSNRRMWGRQTRLGRRRAGSLVLLAPALTTLVFVVVGVGAYLLGRFGI